jgi:hypothetical protein
MRKTMLRLPPYAVTSPRNSTHGISWATPPYRAEKSPCDNPQRVTPTSQLTVSYRGDASFTSAALL